MKTKEKSLTIGKLKYLTLLQLAVMLLLLFSCKQKTQTPAEPATDSTDIPAMQDAPAGEEASALLMVDEQASFQGGDLEDFQTWVQENIYYPKEAIDYGVSGTVMTQFTVNTEGEVVDVVVLRGVAPSLDEEAKRVLLSSPVWEPAQLDGKAVAQQFTIPVEFRL